MLNVRKHKISSAWGIVATVAITWSAMWPQLVKADDRSRLDEAQLPAPSREQELIAILLSARKIYEAANSIEAKKSARLDMQIQVSRFMATSREVINWVGTVQSSHIGRDGDASIAIEIAPNITVSTAPNRTDDPRQLTLIRKGSDLSRVVDKIPVGSPIAFSAEILAFLVGNDDAMMEQPHLFARFSAISK